tara:strand:+ start:2984 stop:3373 length:390 start_codon:yes stop_codon:yes gene_type:complete
MNKKKLAEVLKPIIKECINEMLLEEGLLTKVVQQISEGMEAPPPKVQTEPKRVEIPKAEKSKMREAREKMLESMGKERFNGVNIFEGTTPARASRSPQAQASNPLSDVDPNDSGVDISSFANPNWRKLV